MDEDFFFCSELLKEPEALRRVMSSKAFNLSWLLDHNNSKTIISPAQNEGLGHVLTVVNESGWGFVLKRENGSMQFIRCYSKSI